MLFEIVVEHAVCQTLSVIIALLHTQLMVKVGNDREFPWLAHLRSAGLCRTCSGSGRVRAPARSPTPCARSPSSSTSPRASAARASCESDWSWLREPACSLELIILSVVLCIALVMRCACTCSNTVLRRLGATGSWLLALSWVDSRGVYGLYNVFAQYVFSNVAVIVLVRTGPFALATSQFRHFHLHLLTAHCCSG